MSTFDRINLCLDNLFGKKAESEDQSFTDDLNLDSLDIYEFSFELEDEFCLVIPAEDYADGQITTVRQAVEYIDKALDK